MNDKKELIDAIATGDVKRLKGLRKYTKPGILIHAPDDDGKYFTIPMNGEGEREILLEEIEKLKEERLVIILTRAEGRVYGEISNSEEEAMQRMRDEGELG